MHLSSHVKWTYGLILHAIAVATCLEFLMLDVPSPVSVGETVELTCSYHLQANEQLYSVKWYKDDVEFYRFVPNDWPPGQFLPLPGVKVDLSKSGRKHIYLRNINMHTAGMYRCEVSSEAPTFQTAEGEKEMKVYVLPSSGPRITYNISQSKYEIGDTVIVKCTSAKSKPAAILRWFVNGEMVKSEHQLEFWTTLHEDDLEISNLALRFVVTKDHYKSGMLKLKCTAAIPMLYTMSNEQHIYLGSQQTSGLQVSEVRVSNRASTTLDISWYIIIQWILLTISSPFQPM